MVFCHLALLTHSFSILYQQPLTSQTYVTIFHFSTFSASADSTYFVDSIKLFTCHVLLLLFFFSLVFHCLLLHMCLLFIVMCALDMLLIKATCLRVKML